MPPLGDAPDPPPLPSQPRSPWAAVRRDPALALPSPPSALTTALASLPWQANALLAEQVSWMARRQAERARIVDEERTKAKGALDERARQLGELRRAEQRAELERRLGEAREPHLAAAIALLSSPTHEPLLSHS